MKQKNFRSREKENDPKHILIVSIYLIVIFTTIFHSNKTTLSLRTSYYFFFFFKDYMYVCISKNALWGKTLCKRNNWEPEVQLSKIRADHLYHKKEDK